MFGWLARAEVAARQAQAMAQAAPLSRQAQAVPFARQVREHAGEEWKK
jgi:hypothetical protein